MSDWVQAKTYVILPNTWQRGSLEDQWSACNGVDSFGHDDPEIDKIRRKHGECLENQPGCPRLILFRPKKTSDVMVKLWYTRSLQKDDDIHGIYASLAKAVYELNGEIGYFSIDLIDWDGNRPAEKRTLSDRYELSIEGCGFYADFNEVRKRWRKFMKTFEDEAWE